MPTFKRMQDLPEKYGCRLCNKEKPIVEMIVVRIRKTGLITLRSRCKECHNRRERGHRREYKSRYLRRWRKHNAEINESYWRQRSAEKREEINQRAKLRFYQHHDALLIQGRLRRHGFKVSLKEARELLKKYGRCYPTRFGLTEAGLRECERIRSRFRCRSEKPPSNFQIRMMVYEDSADSDEAIGYSQYRSYVPTKGGKFVINPSKQRQPYQHAAATLRTWRAEHPHVGKALRRVA